MRRLSAFITVAAFAVAAFVPTAVFAWTNPICNPKTGEVFQPSHFPNEAAYFKYIKDHPGSFEMSPGQTCNKPAPPPAPPAPPAPVAPAPVAPAAPVASSAPSSPAPSGNSGGGGGSSFSYVCVTTESESNIHTDTVRTTNADAYLASHPGATRMVSGGNCGPTDLPKAAPVKASIISVVAPPVASAPPVVEDSPPTAMVPPISVEAPPMVETDTPEDTPYIPEDLTPPNTGDGSTILSVEDN